MPHRPTAAGPRLRLEDDRDRPVVHELDRHPRAEDAGLRPGRRGRGARAQKSRRAAPPAPVAPPREKSGRFPSALLSAIRVNWVTTSASPPTSSSERSNFPSSFSKIRRRATLPASRGVPVPVAVGHAESTQRPGADLAAAGRRQPPAPSTPAGRPLSSSRGASSSFERAGGSRSLSRADEAGQLVVAVRLVERPCFSRQRPSA